MRETLNGIFTIFQHLWNSDLGCFEDFTICNENTLVDVDRIDQGADVAVIVHPDLYAMQNLQFFQFILSEVATL